MFELQVKEPIVSLYVAGLFVVKGSSTAHLTFENTEIVLKVLETLSELPIWIGIPIDKIVQLAKLKPLLELEPRQIFSLKLFNQPFGTELVCLISDSTFLQIVYLLNERGVKTFSSSSPDLLELSLGVPHDFSLSGDMKLYFLSYYHFVLYTALNKFFFEIAIGTKITVS